jgi:hypothetical protein
MKKKKKSKKPHSAFCKVIQLAVALLCVPTPNNNENHHGEKKCATCFLTTF